jgi:hypothetical protein
VDNIVNLRLLSHPANWLIVWATLALAGVAWTMLHRSGACGCDNAATS